MTFENLTLDVTSFRSVVAISLAFAGMASAWTASSATGIFLIDGATQRSVRLGLLKVCFGVMATLSSEMGQYFLSAVGLFLCATVQFIDLKESNSRWMQPRIARITAPIIFLVSISTGWYWSKQPLFFAMATTGMALLHVFKMKRHQQEFSQNVQLLRDKLASFDANQYFKIDRSKSAPSSGTNDKYQKAS